MKKISLIAGLGKIMRVGFVNLRTLRIFAIVIIMQSVFGCATTYQTTESSESISKRMQEFLDIQEGPTIVLPFIQPLG